MEDLQHIVRAFYDAISGKGDIGRAMEFISDDESAVFIGSATTEWVVGAKALRGLLEEQFELMPDAVWTAGDLVVRRYGDVGMVADRPTVRFPDGTEVELRMSAVLERKSGRWAAVHAHLSEGADSPVPS